MVDYSHTLTWFVKDSKLSTVLINFSVLLLSCILLLPIVYVIPLLVGYMLDIIKNVSEKKYELPEISPTTQWQSGVTIFLVLFGLGLIVGIITTVVEKLFGYFGFPGVFVAQVFSAITRFGMTYFSAVSLIVFAQTNSIAHVLSFEIFMAVSKKNLGQIVLAIVVGVASAIVCLSVGLVAFCVGVLPAIIVIEIIIASLYGQVDLSFLKGKLEQS